MRLRLLVVLISLALISNASADYWGSTIVTNSSTWYIYRQSQNISFNLSSSVDGKIAPIELNGRVLNPHSSYYAEVGSNDVRLRERTSALEGRYRSEEMMRLFASTENLITFDYYKPTGTDIWTFKYSEKWPVLLDASKNLQYVGRQINDRDFEGNNKDFVGSNFLHNKELTMDRRAIMWLDKMSATVKATDNAILFAEVRPTSYLGYYGRSHTSGIADFKYRLTSPVARPPRATDYPPLGEGEQRYYGAFDMYRRIEMKHVYNNFTSNETWLPCYYNGWCDIPLQDRKYFSADCVFDCYSCRCYEPPSYFGERFYWINGAAYRGEDIVY